MIFIVLIFVTWYFCQVCVSRVIVMMESTLPANEWCISTILHCAGLDCYEWCNCNHPIHHHHHPNHHHYHHCPWCNCSWARTSRNLPLTRVSVSHSLLSFPSIGILITPITITTIIIIIIRWCYHIPVQRDQNKTIKTISIARNNTLFLEIC